MISKKALQELLLPCFYPLELIQKVSLDAQTEYTTEASPYFPFQLWSFQSEEMGFYHNNVAIGISNFNFLSMYKLAIIMGKKKIPKFISFPIDVLPQTVWGWIV